MSFSATLRVIPQAAKVRLELHDIVEPGLGIAFRMMGDDKVDLALQVFVEEVGEEELADLHVDADDRFLNLDLGIAAKDAGVGVRVEKTVWVVVFAVLFIELVETLLLFSQEAIDFFPAPEVVIDTGFDDDLINMIELHRTLLAIGSLSAAKI